jgi:LPS sulfotransferase NodH
MYAAGGLGCPLEYFHHGFQPHLERRWGSNGLAEYVRAVYQHRTDPTGALGVKLFWRDVEELCAAWQPQAFAGLARELEAAPGEALYRKIHAILAEVFPNPCFVYLARHDRLRQAISSLLASQSKQWRLLPDLQPVAAGEPVYDYDRIGGLYALATYSVTHWEGFFRATGIVPCRIAYEDLVADFPAAVGRLFRELGRSDAVVTLPRLRRQANRHSEEFLLRFLRDFQARQGQGRPET